MNKLIEKLLCAVPLLAFVPVAFAGEPEPPGLIPEPGVLELAAIGAAVAIAVAIARRKK
ncbi:MAG TPA: hypothetical protein VIT02_10785 [Burkholderiaceae bacterium]